MLTQDEISSVLRFLRIKVILSHGSGKYIIANPALYHQLPPTEKYFYRILFEPDTLRHRVILYSIYYITVYVQIVYHIVSSYSAGRFHCSYYASRVTSRKKKRLYSSRDGSYPLNWLYKSSSRGVTQVFLLIRAVRGSRWFVGFSCTRRTCWLRVLLFTRNDF